MLQFMGITNSQIELSDSSSNVQFNKAFKKLHYFLDEILN